MKIKTKLISLFLALTIFSSVLLTSCGKSELKNLFTQKINLEECIEIKYESFNHNASILSAYVDDEKLSQQIDIEKILNNLSEDTFFNKEYIRTNGLNFRYFIELEPETEYVNLSNGDIISFKVALVNSAEITLDDVCKELGISIPEKVDITVEGLEDGTALDLFALINENNISYVGANGFGTANVILGEDVPSQIGEFYFTKGMWCSKNEIDVIYNHEFIGRIAFDTVETNLTGGQQVTIKITEKDYLGDRLKSLNTYIQNLSKEFTVPDLGSYATGYSTLSDAQKDALENKMRESLSKNHFASEDEIPHLSLIGVYDGQHKGESTLKLNSDNSIAYLLHCAGENYITGYFERYYLINMTEIVFANDGSLISAGADLSIYADSKDVFDSNLANNSNFIFTKVA